MKPNGLGNDRFDDAPLQVRAQRLELAAIGIVLQHLATGKVGSDGLPDDGNDMAQGTCPSLPRAAEVEAASTALETYRGTLNRAIPSGLPGSSHVARYPCVPGAPK